MKYVDLIAYPIAIGTVYVLMGFVNWNSNPEYWPLIDRWMWVLWGVVWGWALQYRIKWEQT